MQAACAGWAIAARRVGAQRAPPREQLIMKSGNLTSPLLHDMEHDPLVIDLGGSGRPAPDEPLIAQLQKCGQGGFGAFQWVGLAVAQKGDQIMRCLGRQESNIVGLMGAERR